MNGRPIGPAPLLSTAEAPVPAGAEAAFIEGAGGVRLRAALFGAAQGRRGSVVLSPGRTEFIEKYYEVVQELTGRGFAVLVHDWRGQGLSDRLAPDPMAGHARGYADFLSDHRLLLDAYQARLPRPWIALGHSMGGALALLALAKGESRFAAAAFSAPMLGVATGAAPPAAARLVAWLMGLGGRGSAMIARAEPGAPRFEPNPLTHDRRRFERTAGLLEAHPQLGLGPPTWDWLAFALQAGAALAAPGALERIGTPALLALAGEERLVLNPPIRKAAHRLPHARLVEIDGARHEILMETDDRRARFWAAFDELSAQIA